MAVTAVRTTGEQRVVLRDVPWPVYESLLGDHHVRLTYDRGVLELMSPGRTHERIARLVGHLVIALVETGGLDVVDLGSTTFKEPAWERGFEPDGCFYLRDAAAVRRRDDVDARRDPPPEIVLEIDVARTSFDKLPIFARFGVGEVWRHDGQRATILLLQDGEYRASATSRALPSLTADVLTDLTARGLQRPLTPWLAEVRAWAAAARGPEVLSPGETTSTTTAADTNTASGE